MRFIVVALITLLVCLPLTAQTRTKSRPAIATIEKTVSAPGQTLPLKRLILYSNGVAYFERRGTVTGHAEISLPFKQSQVDDVLKSMLVLDLGKGKIGTVSYNSSAPPSARLDEIPFSIEAGSGSDDEEKSNGLAGVLSQLQGAHVSVSTGTRQATGAILTIERRKQKGDGKTPDHIVDRLVIGSDSGDLTSFDLDEIRSVHIIDEGAKHDIKEFADASASARRRDAKTIVVESNGEGAREMIVSYTLAAPIWKTSYRVVLDDSGKPFFQGWAIVDNVGDEDWRDVSLSMVSGSPVSFIQPLQQPLYRYRPVMAIPDDLNLKPQIYDPSTGAEGVPGGVPGGVAGGVPGGVGAGMGSGRGPGVGYGMGGGDMARRAGEPVVSVSDALKNEDAGIETAATGAQIGDLFEYHVEQPVTVLRNRSALIPILQTKLEGERVSIYNESAKADRPMGGLRLKNTSSLTLETGALTVMDGNAYVGEALMERLKPGEERFISYAVDLGTLVTAESKDDREPVFLVRAINGTFQTHYYQAKKKTYVLTNQTDQPKTIYLEHPIEKGWALSDQTAKPMEKTANVYRFRVDLGSRATVQFPVTTRRALMESYALSNLTSNNVELFVSKRYIDDATRTSLQHILDIKLEIAGVDNKLSEMAAELTEIEKDQARLRDNIKALKETTQANDLIARYIAKAGQQETRVEQITAERKKLTDERARFNVALEIAIRAMSLDMKL